MTSTDERVRTLCTCLEPWLSVLQMLRPPDGSTSYRDEYTKDSRIVWLRAHQLFEAPPPSLTLDRVCEALSLHTLIARIDGELWKNVVLKVWPEDESLVEEQELPKTFAVGLEVFTARLDVARNITKSLVDHFSNTAASCSPEFSKACESLKKELRIPRHDNDVESVVRFRIQLEETWRGTSQDNKEMLRCALDAVKTEASTKDEHEGVKSCQERVQARPRFTVTNVDLSSHRRVDMADFKILHELAQLGVSLTFLPAMSVQPSSEELPGFVQALRDLMGLDDDRGAAISAININDYVSSLPVIRAVLTAAQHSSKVHAIVLDVGESRARALRDYVDILTALEGNEDDEDEDAASNAERVAIGVDDNLQEGDESDGDNDVHDIDEQGGADEDEGEDKDEEEDDLDQDFDRCELWQWIAFTLFSRHADHNVEMLQLDLEKLQASEIVAIERVLDATDPYAVVKGRADVSPQRSTPRQIVASRFVLQDPAEDDLGLPFVPKNPIAVRVLENPDECVFPWYQVLLPGYGDSWVHEDDVISKSEADLQLTNRQATPLPVFPCIEIARMTDDSMDPVADLIGIIGHGTRRVLYVDPSVDRDFEDWCVRVFNSCPELEELDMYGGHFDNLNFFEEVARAGHCRLRDLSVSSVPTGDHAEQVQKLFDALCDPTHPLTGHLRQLQVGLLVEAEDPTEVTGPVLRMLTHNQRLVNITISIEFPEPMETLRPEFESALDNRPSDSFVIPLDLRCKLAFLSAVYHEARVRGSLLGQADSSVLATVLQFAAEKRARTCSIFYE